MLQIFILLMADNVTRHTKCKEKLSNVKMSITFDIFKLFIKVINVSGFYLYHEYAKRLRSHSLKLNLQDFVNVSHLKIELISSHDL